MPRFSVVLISWIVFQASLTGCDRPSTAELTSPIHLESIVRADPPFHAVVAKIDLVNPRVELVACAGGPDPDGPGPWETVLRTPSDIARDQHLDLAINGGFFVHQASSDDPTKYSAGDPARAAERVIIDGRRMTVAGGGVGIAVDNVGVVQIGPSDVLGEAGMKYLISGPALIVDRGKACVTWDDPVAPRSGAGLTEDGRTLILMVVDGRRPEWGLGLTTKAFGDEMARQGAYSAISLDGGGSSTIVSKNKEGRYQVLNRPSDGSTLPIPLSVERPVPYVLGIRIKP